MTCWYVEVDTYWQNSPSVFFGPYATKEAALLAADSSKAARSDLGRMAANIKYQTRILSISTKGDAIKSGMRDFNTVPASCEIPGDTTDFSRLIEDNLLFQR